MSNWRERVLTTLRLLSDRTPPVPTNINEFALQWVWVSFHDSSEPIETCELCGKEGLRYLFTVRNKINKRELEVGSECIKQFSGDDIDPELIVGTILDRKRQKEIERIGKADAVANILREARDRIGKRDDVWTNDMIREIADGELSIRPMEMHTLEPMWRVLDASDRRIVKHGLSVNLRSHIDSDSARQYVKRGDEISELLRELMSSSQRAKFFRQKDDTKSEEERKNTNATIT